MDYVILALAVLAVIGLGLVYKIFGPNGSCGDDTNCSGDCNQGRTCDCKGKK